MDLVSKSVSMALSRKALGIMINLLVHPVESTTLRMAASSTVLSTMESDLVMVNLTMLKRMKFTRDCSKATRDQVTAPFSCETDKCIKARSETTIWRVNKL